MSRLQGSPARYGATGPGFPGGATTYVPSFAGSGNLVIGFSRNPKRFPLPRYIMIVKTPQEYFYYLRLTPNVAARVVNMRDFAWPANQPRPRPIGLETFNFVPVHTRRWSYGFQLDQLGASQASWDVADAHVQISAARGMTARTNRVANVLLTASNWGTHTNNATSLAGGKVDAGTSTNPYLHISLNKMAIAIGKDTRSTVQNGDLRVILNPSDAAAISVAAEVQDYAKGSYWVRKVLEEGLGDNTRYGIPDSFYGYPFIVDDTVLVTTQENTDSVNYAAAGTYCYTTQNLIMLSRPGGIEGVFGSQSFSTFTLFAFEEFTQEQFNDQKNRLLDSFVTENTAEELTAPVSGYLLTAATSAT
jgi:hypothetical protein